MNYYEAAALGNGDLYERQWLWCITLKLPNSFNEMLVHLVDPDLEIGKLLVLQPGDDLKEELDAALLEHDTIAVCWGSVYGLQPNLLELDTWQRGSYSEMLAYLRRHFSCDTLRH